MDKNTKKHESHCDWKNLLRLKVGWSSYVSIVSSDITDVGGTKTEIIFVITDIYKNVLSASVGLGM